MIEIWNDIKNYEGLYQVSNLGNIKSLDHVVKVSNQYKGNSMRLVKGKSLKYSVDKDGYFQVSLSKNNIVKTKRVHRLVIEAFKPNLEKLPAINHKDENKQNNKVSNLEWCTVKYNTNYNNMPLRRAECRRRKILQIDTKGNIIKQWNSVTEATKFYNISHGNVSMCCNNKRKTANGCVWKYLDDLAKLRGLENDNKK